MLQKQEIPMSRLPPLVELDLSADGVPRARQFEDVYFSAQDGLEESRTVFLQGVGLPQSWSDREQFCIGELGFGSGLNILAVMQLWAATRPSPSARLHVVSIEGFPMTQAQARQALAPWQELSPWRDWLLEHWPSRARGIRRMHYPALNFTLTLVTDDVEAALNALVADSLPAELTGTEETSGPVNAWLLDGFAPARNPAMWSEAVFAHISRLSAPDARLASFTVAGFVRRGLAAQGFSVVRKAGYGRKRQRLVAERVTTYSAPATRGGPQTALILGAGIAGAAMAQALCRRGVRVEVLEAGVNIASGASGNPLGLVMPRLDAADGPLSRALIDAFLYARTAYCAAPAPLRQLVAVLQKAHGDVERRRFGKLLADPPLDSEDLAPGDENDPTAALILGQAMMVRPADIIQHWLEGVSVRTNTAVASVHPKPNGAEGWQAHDISGAVLAEADSVFLCGGAGLMSLAAGQGLPLAGRAGQVESAHLSDVAPAAVTCGTYALRWGPDFLFGATFTPTDRAKAETDLAAQAENLASLAALAPDWHAELGANGAISTALDSRAAVRATTPDRLPIVGPLGQTPGQYVLTGLGARGLVWAPYLAEDLASRLFGEPPLMTTAARRLFSPERWTNRMRKAQA